MGFEPGARPLLARTVVAGIRLSRLVLSLFQGPGIMAGCALLFGVDWGDPVAAALVLVAFSLVGAGAGMAVGAVVRSERQPTAAVDRVLPAFAAVVVPAVGETSSGTMLPAVMPSPSRRLLAFTALDLRGGGLADVLPRWPTRAV